MSESAAVRKHTIARTDLLTGQLNIAYIGLLGKLSSIGQLQVIDSVKPKTWLRSVMDVK